MGLWNTQNEIILGLGIPLCKSLSIHYSPQSELLKVDFLFKEAGSGQWYTCSEYSTNKYLLSVFSGSDSPSGTYDIAVSKTHKDPYLTEVYIRVRIQNTDVPISGNKLGRKLHKSSLFNWWLRNCQVKTLLIPCVWFQCTQKDVTFGKQDCMG